MAVDFGFKSGTVNSRIGRLSSKNALNKIGDGPLLLGCGDGDRDFIYKLSEKSQTPTCISIKKQPAFLTVCSAYINVYAD